MFSLNDLAAFFGGTIPAWFWVVAGIVLIVLLVVFGGSSAAKSYSKGDIKVGRDMSGCYYAYDAETGTVLYNAPTKQEVANWVATQVR